MFTYVHSVLVVLILLYICFESTFVVKMIKIKMSRSNIYGEHPPGIVFGIMIFILLLMMGGAGAAKEIGSCTNIFSPGTYLLNQSITMNSGNSCINIASGNVIFDGNGYSIKGSGKGNGVYLEDRKGVTIKNLNISNFHNGIYLEESKNNNIVNNTVNRNRNGIYLEESKNNNIENSNISSNSGSGIYIKESKNNNISNNFFNNTNNVRLIDSFNKWNTTKTPGVNIAGGLYLGGNIWIIPNGTGFSQACTDSNSDGICDSSYTLAFKNVDFLPLVYKPAISPTSPPVITGFVPESPISDAAGSIRAFSIAIDQVVNVTWYLNGTRVQFNDSVTIANYTNTSTAAGIWNVTAAVSNSNGTASHTWMWTVNAYIPGIPANLANTTGNFWVNHTWSAGANTDSFNISVNGNWDNGSNILFRNTTSSSHGWVNITVAGYNATSQLLSDFVSLDTRIPNNPISITDIQDSYSLNEGGTLYIDANYTDADSDTATFARNFSQGTFDTSGGILSWMTGAGDAGVYSWQINVTDRYGSVSTKMFTVTVATASISPPKIISSSPLSPVTNSQVEARLFNITANQTVNVTWYINGIEVFNQNDVTESSYTNTSAAPGTWNVNATALNSNGTDSKEWIWSVTSSELPPDPGTVAPPVDTTVATNIATSTEFLYTGSDPIQTGVAPDTIEVMRAAVLRGRVLTREGTNLSGVNITILSHPEFGSTISRADGMFDMAVNGGGLLTVNYEKAGYLAAQRQVQTPRQDFAWLSDVVLIQADTQVTAVNLSSGAPIQVARSSVVNDIDGARQATLLFPQGVQANMTLPDGTTQPLAAMHVRATEYTVGANGPDAMPAQLPSNSGYTYAVEFSVDEAPGASEIYFNQPLPFYLENFLNFSVGTTVPLGSYNRSLGQWIASDNGIVIRVLNITGGLADIDVDGSNQSANASQLAALGITDAERQQLTTLYQPNETLWRMPIPHFTQPWDANQGTRCEDNKCDFPKQPDPNNNPNPNDPCQQSGSIIGCETQTLGESIGITGAPFDLHYQSDRVPGRKGAYTLKIPLSGASLPENLKGIDLEVFVAGRKFIYSFPVAPNQFQTFTWDGKDAYGRILQGDQPVDVRIGYVYKLEYVKTDRFGYNGNGAIMADRARQDFVLWQVWKGNIGTWDAPGQGLGGWSLRMCTMCTILLAGCFTWGMEADAALRLRVRLL